MQFRLKGSADRSALAQCAGLLFLACLPALSTAAAPPPFIGTDAVPGAFPLADSPGPAPIWVDPSDSPGVHHAARSLRSDLESVCGRAPVLLDAAHPSGSNVVIIGTLGRSPLLDNWAAAGKINTNEVQGRWESFLLQVVRDPEPGIASALVIAGSDKRGTIYGVYEVSEQSGVSPWYWWADVPVPHRDRLFAGPGRFVQGPPAVRYRGIFLNDEAPSLTGWVTSRYGNYNHSFYTNVFELLLRLRANCLWPAMWNNCFNQDDPLNPKLADEYGIVMGTSHVEPMMRADKEWNRLGHTAADWNYDTHAAELRAFWKDGLEAVRPYENLITIAMRGKIDTPMSESANIALLERIVADQRGLIASVWQTNPAAVPQVWALYKEVQEYYEKGMRVPDDVTLLWCDDNWGNLRRLP
ncbi:MAG: glycosyl hydrolase 115 family protein, partial [Verrucomicrobiota bacterium]